MDQIDWDIGTKRGEEGREAARRNERCIAELLRSLTESGTLSGPRLRYWTDPQYNIGLKQHSRKQVFERNGLRGTRIYGRARFIRHLKYLLYGPSLPDDVLRRFEEAATNADPFTSGDVLPLAEVARDATREQGWAKEQAAEGFFLLSLELGLPMYSAVTVHRRVMQLKIRNGQQPRRTGTT